MIGTRPFEISDFSLGITDTHVDADPRASQTLDNFILTVNNKPLTRPGSTLDDSTAGNERIPNSGRINTLINHANGDTMLVHSATKCYYRNPSAFSTLQGPVDSNDIFPGNSASNFLASTLWNDHTLVSSDSFDSVKKIYKDENDTLQLRTAGLPSPRLQSAIAFANALKATFNAHLADTGEHTTAADTVNTITSDDATNLQTLITLVTEMLTDYPAHDADAVLSTPAYHAAQTTANDLASTAAPTTLTECITRLDDLKAKYNLHEADSTSHGTGSQHTETANTDIQLASAGGAGNNYIYAFLYFYEYTVGSVVYQDLSAVRQVSVSNVGEPSANTITISELPDIDNGSVESFDTDNIKIHIYRTVTDGDTLYYLQEVDVDAGSTTDTADDDDIINNAVIYTDGGVLDFDQPPPSKFVHTVDGVTYYAHVKEGSQVNKSKILQSISDDPDSVPGSLNTIVDDEITGLHSVTGSPIVFCKRHVYRLDGIVDKVGAGNTTAKRISETAGCISNQSIVRVENTLFWFGQDGIYTTDGYTVSKVSDGLNTRYAAYRDNTSDTGKIVGTYDELEKRVYWTVESDDSSNENDAILVLDVRRGIRSHSTFYTWTGQTSFQPSSVLFYEKYLYRADARGWIFKHDPDVRTDPKVVTTDEESTWVTETIIWNWKSVTTNFDGTYLRKWVPKILVTCGNKSNVTIQINGFNDDSTFLHSLKLLQFDNNIVWGDPFVVWGDESIVWGFSNSLEQWRRFAGTALRCSYKQIQLTNGYGIIQNSDQSGTAAINTIAKTVTLEDATNGWALQPVDYKISFDTDNYTKEYTITARTSDTVLTVSDTSNNLSTSTGVKWVIKGYRRGDILNLLNVNIHWAPFTPSQDKFFTSQLRENA